MNRNYNITGLLKDWVFRIEEVSAGQFLMDGVRRTGETISRDGTDEFQLAERIAAEAIVFDEKYLNPQKEPFREFYFNTDLSERFPEELNRIILEEILLGNWIQEIWTGYGNGVMLAGHFRKPRTDVKSPLVYREVNDTHYWKDEVGLEGTDYFVASSFK